MQKKFKILIIPGEKLGIGCPNTLYTVMCNYHKPKQYTLMSRQNCRERVQKKLPLSKYLV